MKTHILVVDDDIDEMKAFVEALKQVSGPFTCTYASNGIHAMKMLSYLKPEIIFVDYYMPAMNGLEFIEELRAREELAQIPVFLYGRQIRPDIQTRAEEIGVAG